MFDHVKFGVSGYAASKAFFLKALEPLVYMTYSFLRKFLGTGFVPNRV